MSAWRLRAFERAKMFNIYHNDKCIESHERIQDAEHAFWVLTAHELKNGRPANLRLDKGTCDSVRHPLLFCCLPIWAVEVLQQHGFYADEEIFK
jgi:hypothetical protein